MLNQVGGCFPSKNKQSKIQSLKNLSKNSNLHHKPRKNITKKKKNQESSNLMKMKKPERVSQSLPSKMISTFLNLIDQFKTYRKIMFAVGKTMKYLAWGSFVLFWYHIYLIKKTEKPEKGLLASEFFLNMARQADYFFYDMNLLLTRPPVEKLLPDRPPLPPGAAYPKTLVLNLRGTLIHSEYKVC